MTVQYFLTLHYYTLKKVLDTLINWLRFYVPPDTKYSISETSSQPISWLSIEKRKQQKQTCVHNKIYYNIILTQKTKARFGHQLRHPAWKRNGSILEGVDR